MPDETTDETTSHLTSPAKDAEQVIDEATSHLTKAASCQVIGYGHGHLTDEAPSHSTMLSKSDNQVAGYKQANDVRQVAGHNTWDERYAGEDFFFGTEPNEFLVSQRHLLKPGMSCLTVADGEGRNGVWLAQQGLHVLSVEASPLARKIT